MVILLPSFPPLLTCLSFRKFRPENTRSILLLVFVPEAKAIGKVLLSRGELLAVKGCGCCLVPLSSCSHGGVQIQSILSLVFCCLLLPSAQTHVFCNLYPGSPLQGRRPLTLTVVSHLKTVIVVLVFVGLFLEWDSMKV